MAERKLTKSIIKNKNMGFFDAVKFPTFSEKYELGFPDIKGTNHVVIQFRYDEVEFKILSGFNTKKITLKPDDIIEVGLNQESYRSSGKAAAGAIVGGILTGGIGLLAGAAMGGKRRKENQLRLVVNYMGTDCDVIITPSKNIPTIYAELKKLMGKQTKKPEQINTTEQKQIETKPQIDIAAELEKLHGLVQKGILTQDEFDAQKKKLLS
ncbi:MAG: SHOCT domain-containing protein [Bacteroidetes bacterium]|nr:SHOCT domain-containing protein [Bacteroidota bacterium]